MADVFTKEKRSEVMSRIRSRGNRDTELALMAILRARKIFGWRRHLAIPGRPDFAFRLERVAVFVDGCFWHCCPRCGTRPSSNRQFWEKKLAANRSRDRKVNRLLRQRDWKVVRIWEHELNDPARIAHTLQAVLRLRMSLQGWSLEKQK